jgi:hypothetical protein
VNFWGDINLDCGDCVHWSWRGCDCYVLDTGEVFHYREDAEEDCVDFEES